MSNKMSPRELLVKRRLKNVGRKFDLAIDVGFTDRRAPLSPPFLPNISTKLPGKFEIPRPALELLDEDELEAAFLHEVAHVKGKHYLKDLIAAITPPLFVLIIFWDWLAFALVAIGMTFLVLWFHRRFELEADSFAAENSSASAMIGALRKVTENGEHRAFPYNLSHPRVEDRIEALRKEGTDKPADSRGRTATQPRGSRRAKKPQGVGKNERRKTRGYGGRQPERGESREAGEATARGW